MQELEAKMWQKLPKSDSGEFVCLSNLDLYNSANCQELATQAARGRQLHILSSMPLNDAIEINLCEDNYQAWLPLEQLERLQPAARKYQPLAVSRPEIQAKLPQVIAFAQKAMQQPNYYLWGGTVAPNYDCSGLIQAAYVSVGIWLPRDSYQQEAFTHKISIDELQPGDLIFFGDRRVNHVALHLGDRYYIHSSGKETGRNGIGIDRLSEQGNEVSRTYYRQFWSCGRVMSSYRAD
jgi:cell wall-associated NlpC family hydrolase